MPVPTADEVRSRALAIINQDDELLAKMGRDKLTLGDLSSDTMRKYERKALWTFIEADVLRLTLAGYTPAEIAAKEGITEAAVRMRINRLLSKVARRAGSEEWRGKEVLRYERIMTRLWSMVDPDDPDEKPNFAAIDKFIALSKARRELLGLDKPVDKTVKIDGTVHVNHTADEKANVVEEWLTYADRFVDLGIGSGIVKAIEEESQEDGDIDSDIEDAEVIEDEPADDTPTRGEIVTQDGGVRST